MTRKLLFTILGVFFVSLFSGYSQTVNCGDTFTDPAGPNANYADNTDYTVTICPTNVGEFVTVTFSEFNTEANWDGLYVFNGDSIDDPQIASTNPAANVPGGLSGSFWGTTIPGPFTSSSADGCLTFRFRSDNTINRPGWVASVTCAPPPTCAQPLSLQTLDITTTSAALSWTNTSSATQWEVLALPCGSPTPTATSNGVISTTNPHVFTGLTPFTCYTFYVRNICSSTDSSFWSAAANITTLLAPPTCGGNFTDPAGPNANYADDTDYTITICPDTPGDLVTVTFTEFNIEATWDGLYVYDGNSTAAPQISSGNLAGNVPGGLPGAFWGTTIPEPITSSSADGCLTFRFISDDVVNRPGWIANVTCDPPPTCPRPNNLISTATTTNSTNLSWNSNSTATTWNVLALPCGSPVPTAATTGWQVAMTNPFVYNGLFPDTCYTFYVRGVCSDTDSSNWSIGLIATTQQIPPACGGIFTDSGGANANYTNNADSTVTICPENSNGIITVTFTQFDVQANSDGLYVFDGNSTSAPQIASANGAGTIPGGLAGAFWGTTIPGPFTSTSVDGCLTFRFRSNVNTTGTGWVANVTCGIAPDRLLLIAFLDSNNNGIKENAESYFPHGSYITQMNNSGADNFINTTTGYHSILDANPSNTYDMSFEISPEYSDFFSTPSMIYEDINIPLGSGTQVFYFPVTSIQLYTDVAVSIVPQNPPRPANSYVNTVVYTNTGSGIASGTITFTKDANVTITGISQPGAVPTATGFTYNYSNLAPFETRAITVTMSVPNIPIVSIGDILTNSVSISSTITDFNSVNNSFSSSQIVIAAYDPNDKMESHGGTILHLTFTSNDYLYYTIRFENIGTAEARTVYINDILDEQLDETTFTMLSSSHSYVVSRVGNQLNWTFENINLPVSIPNSTVGKGQVFFKIKPVAGYEVGDIIPNFATIFFESNPAIVTNTFTTEFVETLGNTEFETDNFIVHPNPANDQLNIVLSQNLGSISSIKIIDALGKTILSQKGSYSNAQTVNVNSIQSGIYFIEVTTDTNSKTIKKLIIK
ncbi:MAG: T9SS type A sorting domain-containing protein [Flavobacteriales bacterium]|nr:T9SS type A sorting domain-containing protein [Flavobacteriales bacterium]